ncbi:MAG: CDF family Co(II)/Ni(II) efflux transporter DmeF [Desulfobacteraceae bacterium]|nr:CDF family Co(II)/Ni(II) efflux transporter DmeF [Desulfobacteraceae bacterium]
MDTQNIVPHGHHHRFEAVNSHNENKIRIVVLLTLVTMVVEIAAGYLYGSMALLADGWHMGTHAAALGISIVAYMFARKYADDRRFTFGTGKVGVLGGFSSAIILAVAALVMAVESVGRILSPEAIQFNQAIIVAVVGLVVNILSAFMLQLRPRHIRASQDNYHHHDHNFKAAYLHVLADALTSFLAIFALLGGKYFTLIWMDPLMGITGAVLILRWAFVLVKDSGSILLDAGVAQKTIIDIKAIIEAEADNKVSDIHVWKIGPKHLGIIICLVTSQPKVSDHYKKLIADHFRQSGHVTIEVKKRMEDEQGVKNT